MSDHSVRMRDANALLRLAVQTKDIHKLRLAIRGGADPNGNAIFDGRCPLDWAVATGSLTMVVALLEAGARLTEPRVLALHLASERGDVDLLKALLQGGGGSIINRFDAEGLTPLMRAVKASRTEAVAFLLQQNADVRARDVFVNEYALRLAAAESNLEIVKMLVAAGADPLRPARMSLTALDRARERHTPEGRMIANYLERVIAERSAPRKRARR